MKQGWIKKKPVLHAPVLKTQVGVKENLKSAYKKDLSSARWTDDGDK